MSELIKSKQRVKERGEVFTPPHIVGAMLDLIPLKEDTTFFEPACGNGNFLVEILRRKLSSTKNPNIINCIKSIYAVDIMPDNISEAKERMIKIAKPFFHDLIDLCEAIDVLNKNIQVGDTINRPDKIIITDWKTGNTCALAEMLA